MSDNLILPNFLKRNLSRISAIFIVFLLFSCSGPLKITLTETPDATPATSFTPELSRSNTAEASKNMNVPTGTPTVLTQTSLPTLLIMPTITNVTTVTPTQALDKNQAILRIVSPGPMSKVVSPLEFIVNIAPGYTGTTRIELIGENGIELYRKVFKTYSNIGYYTRVDEQVGFEIQGVAEIARLQISTLDINGRVQAFNSMRLLLQSVGENEITPGNDVMERVRLRFPEDNQLIIGNNLPVMGEYLPIDQQPLILEILGDNGAILGSRVLQLDPQKQGYQPFVTEIPFVISNKTTARLVIRQSDDRIDGLAYLYSRLIVLSPN